MVESTTNQASASDRIRLEAMRIFADVGFEGASIRRIAEAADVSPALVMHHYGSKEGLRTACDEYARSATRESLGRIVSLMSGTQPATRAVFDQPAPTLLGYVARAVVDGNAPAREDGADAAREPAIGRHQRGGLAGFLQRAPKR